MRSRSRDFHVCAARTRTGTPWRSHRECNGQRDTNSHTRFSEPFGRASKFEYGPVINDPLAFRLLLCCMRPEAAFCHFAWMRAGASPTVRQTDVFIALTDSSRRAINHPKDRLILVV